MNLLIVSHTHWDREWYRPFQEFRFSLVELVDYLLDLLSRDEQYKYFMLDGQTVVLEDYLELRPERRDELTGWIRAGRLLVGPWYVLPDEFLVSGESLVRNLLEGQRVASSFGEPMPVGYIPDPFGHVAQMPQILRGFGITSAAIWRGLGRDLRSSEFWWSGLDGRSVLALHLADSYSNAADLPRDPELLKRRLTRIRAGLEPLAATPYLVLMNGRDHGFPQKELPEIIRTAAACCPEVTLEHASLPIIMRRLAEQDGSGWPVVRGELRSGERSPLLPGVLSARMWIKQRNAVCEALLEKWAEPFAAWAHLRLGEPDQREMLRYAWRQLLVNHAHDSICGCSVDQVHDEMAPRFDQIEQLAERIVDRALGALARHVAIGGVPAGAPSGPGAVVFNPLAWPRSDSVVLSVPPELAGGLVDQDGTRISAQIVGPERTDSYDLDMPPQEIVSLLEMAGAGNVQGWDAAALSRLESWGCGLFGDSMTGGRLSDVSIAPGPQGGSYRVVMELGHGRSGDHDLLGRALSRLARIAADHATRVIQLRVVRRQVQVCFVPPAVPACGYAGYRLTGTSVASGAPGASTDAVRDFGNGLEDAHLRVEVDGEDGSLTLIDRGTGEVYRGLNRFVDGGDAGDEYNYSPPRFDRLISRPMARPIVTVVESGPVRASLRIDCVLELPAALADDRGSRSDSVVECPASVTVSLAADARRLEIRVELTNLARDHRLRVHFPTGCDAGRAFVGGHFAVLERAHELPVADGSWIEQPIGTRPLSGFVDVARGKRGLLLASRGLSEYEVLTTPAGDEIALTLLRSVGWLSRDDLLVRVGHAGPGFPTPGAQCLGPQTFEYAVIPHLGGWRSVVREAQSYLYSLRARLAPGRENDIVGRDSFFALEPEPLEVTATKVAEDGRGLIVRFYNPLPEPVTARLAVRPPCTGMTRCDLAERSVETIPTSGGTAALQVGPGEIVTLRLLFSSPRPSV